MWNLKSSVSAICRGNLGRECVLSQAHQHPVASSDSSSLPSCWRHFPRSSGYIWVICLFPARSTLNMRARTAACALVPSVTTGPFLPLLLAPTSKHTAHITLYPLSQVFSGRAVSTCARHCWATDRGSEGPRTAGGAQGQQSHGLGGLLLGSQGPWRPVRGIRHSGVRVHKNQPRKHLFGERTVTSKPTAAHVTHRSAKSMHRDAMLLPGCDVPDGFVRSTDLLPPN